MAPLSAKPCGDGRQPRRVGAVVFLAVGCAATSAAAAAEAAASSTAGPSALRGRGTSSSTMGPPAVAVDAEGRACGGPWENCIRSRCCDTPGYRCYSQHMWYAQCMPSCEAKNGWSCRDLSGPGAPTLAPAPSAPVTSAPAPAPSTSPLPPASSTTPPTPPPESTTPAPVKPPGVYTLDWEAKGETFFDDWHWVTFDGNHGASDFVPSIEAARASGVAKTSSTHAILAAGGRGGKAYKRETGKIATKRSWKHFLAMMKFSHVPYGCGVWPAFYTLGTGVGWPWGGEMDILEYVHDLGSMTSFHTGKDCKLDPAEVNRYKPMPDMNLAANNFSEYNCLTKYCATCTSLGCAPNELPLRTGFEWARRPGVLAMQRTPTFAKIFYLPDSELPGDLEESELSVEGWDRWVIAYYPFAASAGCPNPDDVMSPQMFILSIAFCGDWASKAWAWSGTCSNMGSIHNASATAAKLPIDPASGQCRAVDPLAEDAPAQDCCTQFIADDAGAFGTEGYLEESAFFNVSWFKVFV